MKKLAITAVVLACAASMASAQTVTSANTVGYSKKSLSAGQFQIVSPQFQGSATGTTLGAAFSGLNNASAVFTWNGSAYTKYDYFAGYGWFDAIFTPSDGVVIGQGDAVWLKDGGAGADAIMAGEVTDTASITNTLVAGFNLVANPYPVSLTLDDIPVASLSNADAVFVWDGSAYTKYDYFTGYGWFDAIFTPSGGVSVDVGQGFWLNSAAGGSLILNKLY